jgi:hypothetical protein
MTVIEQALEETDLQPERLTREITGTITMHYAGIFRDDKTVFLAFSHRAGTCLEVWQGETAPKATARAKTLKGRRYVHDNPRSDITWR